MNDCKPAEKAHLFLLFRCGHYLKCPNGEIAEKYLGIADRILCYECEEKGIAPISEDAVE